MQQDDFYSGINDTLIVCADVDLNLSHESSLLELNQLLADQQFNQAAEPNVTKLILLLE